MSYVRNEVRWLCVAFLLCLSAWGQTDQGRIVGIITDSQGERRSLAEQKQTAGEPSQETVREGTFCEMPEGCTHWITPRDPSAPIFSGSWTVTYSPARSW